MSRGCFDCFWLERVKLNSTMSTCRTRSVGAVLVRGNRTVADGFNGNLPGHPHCDEGYCDRCNSPSVVSGASLERCVCCHAEQNIVAYCARFGVSMDMTTLYLPCTPCLDCFKLVAGAGVREIVYAQPYPGSEEIVRSLASQSSINLRSYRCACPPNPLEYLHEEPTPKRVERRS